MSLFFDERYAELLASLARHANILHRTLSTRIDYGGVMLSPQEFQVLESLIRWEGECLIMCELAERLGLSRSSVTNIGRYLCTCSLAERFRFPNNQKSIILQATDKGRAVHENYMKKIASKRFSEALHQLDPVPDEVIERFVKTIHAIDRAVLCEEELQLVKLK